MESSLKIADSEEIHYSRQRFKNRVFSKLVSFVTEKAEKANFTRRNLALAIEMDPAQLTRTLSKPSNLTLETISDILTALGAEMDVDIVELHDRVPSNYMHPLMERLHAPAQQVQVVKPPKLDAAAIAKMKGRTGTQQDPNLASIDA